MDDILEKSGLLGKYEVCEYQHGVLTRWFCPLLIYELPISTVERIWLGIPKSFCSIGLYSTGSKQPVTSIVEEYKLTKTLQAMMLQNSKDVRLWQADTEVRRCCKWLASRALREMEALADMRKPLGQLPREGKG